MMMKLISNWEGVCPIPFFSGVQGIFLLWMTLLANYECKIIFCGGQGLGQESWPVKRREEYVNLDSASASAVRSLPQKNPSSFPKTTAFSIQKSQSLPSFARAIKAKKNLPLLLLNNFQFWKVHDRLHSQDLGLHYCLCARLISATLINSTLTC